MPKPNLTILLWIAVGVLLALQIKSCVDPKPVNEAAIRNDEKVKALQREIELKDSLYNKQIAGLDSITQLLSDKITNNKTGIQQSNDRIKTLPSRINSMSIADLLRTIDE